MWRFLLLAALLCVNAGTAAQGLRVGISPNFPPLAYYQEGQLVGVEADNIRAVGGLLQQRLEVVEMPFPELIPALKSGKIDIIMSGMSITPEREREVIFTQPYMKAGQMVILLQVNAARFGQPWAIYREGIRVGVEGGTTGADFAENELSDARILFYDGPDAAFEGLRKNEIDLFVHDAPTSWQLATSKDNGDLLSLYSPLNEEYLAWAVRKDDEVLADRLNSALRSLQRNDTLGYILNRWIPVTIEVK